MSKFLHLIDCGHGGRHPDGYYTSAPNKMYVHGDLLLNELSANQLDLFTMNDGTGTFCEGISNRTYGYTVARLAREKGLDAFEYIAHPYIDTSLTARVVAANALNAIRPCIYWSFHHNASKSHKAKGLSIWTSRGETLSDAIAESSLQLMSRQLREVKIRTEKSLDNDSDYEANFFVLKNTKCPAILYENLFFDNADDVLKIMSIEYLNLFCASAVDNMIWVENNL